MPNSRPPPTRTTHYSLRTSRRSSRGEASGSSESVRDYGNVKINNRSFGAYAADGLWEQSDESIKWSNAGWTSGRGAVELLSWCRSCEEYQSESAGDRDQSWRHRGPDARDANGI